MTSIIKSIYYTFITVEKFAFEFPKKIKNKLLSNYYLHDDKKV